MSGETTFAQNPFRQLGLPATATTAEIRRSYEELAVRLDLGATDQELTPEQLRSIKQALDDPIGRTKSGLFWLHSPRELVDPGIQPHDEEAVGAAIERLKDQAGRPPGREQAIALHDLAVLSYVAYLEGHRGSDQLDMALAAWAEVTEGTQFWSYVQERASEVGDQRLTPEAVERMRSELPVAILNPLARNAASVLSAGDVTTAADLTQTIRRSGLPEHAVESAVKEATAPIRARIQHGLTACKEANAKAETELDDPAALKSRLDAAEVVLIEHVLAPATQLTATDPLLDDTTLLDQAARAARQLSVLFANHLRDWGNALVLIEEAQNTARSSHLLAELAGDQALVANNYHQFKAAAASTIGAHEVVVAHLELAAPWAEDAQESLALQQQALRLRGHIGFWGTIRMGQEKEEIAARLASSATVFENRVRKAAGLPVEATADSSSPPPGAERRPESNTPHPRYWRRWLAAAVACLGVVLLIALAAEMSGSDPMPDGQETAADLAAIERDAEQARAEERARERAQKREAHERRVRARERRRRARERRAREARRRARATSFSCSRFDIDVTLAKRGAQQAQKKLDALRGNPAAFNAALPEANRAIANYNRLLRKKCDPQ